MSFQKLTPLSKQKVLIILYEFVLKQLFLQILNIGH